jgi:hypothetical protein
VLVGCGGGEGGVAGAGGDFCEAGGGDGLEGIVSWWVGMRFWVRFGGDARELGVRVRAYECVGHVCGLCVCFDRGDGLVRAMRFLWCGGGFEFDNGCSECSCRASCIAVLSCLSGLFIGVVARAWFTCM